jgi:hypothetical protein
MKLIYLAMLALGAFVAIWILVVVPAERRHHERKLENIRKQLEKRQVATQRSRPADGDSGLSKDHS